MSNLVFINETSVVDGNSTVSVDNVFSADYTAYKVTLTGFNTKNHNDYFYLKLLDSSGSVITSSTYDMASLLLTPGAQAERNHENNNSGLYSTTNLLDKDTAFSYGATMYVFGPHSSSSFTYIINESSANYDGGIRNHRGVGYEATAGTVRGMQFITGLGIGTADVFASGTIRTYGLAIT